MLNFLSPYGLQHSRLSCSSLSPGVCSNSCPLSQWCFLIISSSATLFSFCLQSFPASGFFPIFSSSVQNIEDSASTSVLPMNIQDWFPLRLTGSIFLLSKGLSRVFSSTTLCFVLFFFLIFKLYKIVLVLPDIKMNPPQVYIHPSVLRLKKSEHKKEVTIKNGLTLRYIHDYWKNHNFDYEDLCHEVMSFL